MKHIMGSDLYAICVENKQQSICRLHIRDMHIGVCVRASWTPTTLNAVVIIAPATGKHRRKWLTYGKIFFIRFFQFGFCFCRYFFGFLRIWKRTFMSYDGRAIKISMCSCSMCFCQPHFDLCQMPTRVLITCVSSLKNSFFSSSCHLRIKKRLPNMRIANRMNKMGGKKWKSNKIKLASVLIKNDRKIIMKRAWKRYASLAHQP